MRVHAILNNYQLGSYAHRCLYNSIVVRIKVDKFHTKVVWDLDSESEVKLLQRALGDPKRLKEGN